MSYFNEIRFADTPSLDAFSRLRVSQPTGIFDAQFTYNLNNLLFQQVTNGTGASISHDSTNRMAGMAFSATATGGKAFMQSYEHFRYQPGKSQLVFITFNMIEKKANCLKFAGCSDGSNGIEFQIDGTTVQFKLYSDTTNGDQTKPQAEWSLDRLDGNGGQYNPSGLELDIEQTQILVIDYQALYVGRVRVGFDIGGKIIFVHEFLHANEIANPYIQTANLPIRCGMTCTGTVTTTMKFICCSVSSEGGIDDTIGYQFSAQSNLASPVSAGSGTRTHFVSIQPRATFNSIANRAKIVLDSVDVLVTGSNPVFWELCLGQAFASDSTANVNSTYSVMDTVTGTLSGDPAIVIDSGFVNATATNRGAINARTNIRYPITLDVDGAARILGRVTLLIRGVGGASNCYGQLKWREIR